MQTKALAALAATPAVGVAALEQHLVCGRAPCPYASLYGCCPFLCWPWALRLWLDRGQVLPLAAWPWASTALCGVVALASGPDRVGPPL
ncbi:hypothetical protein BHE74_00059636 [Ensete ventricosum]|nr:hypothetical protein BHE74_00059636 [Ensete ventricosum]